MYLRLLLFYSLLLPSALGHIPSSFSHDVRCLLEFKKGIVSDPSGLVLSSWTPPRPPESNYSGASAPACPSSWHGVSCDASGTAVTAVSLDDLGLGGEIKFAALAGMRLLGDLSLSGNFLTGRLVPALGSLSSLQRLDLSGNLFYGPISGRIAELWNLQHLNLSCNAFSGVFPTGFQNLPGLKELDLRSNGLSGHIGSVLSEMRNVEYLDLSGNEFYGGLLMESGNLSSLANAVKYANLSSNKLNGSFFSSDSLRLFRNLEVLDVGNNQLSGELPSFDSLRNLKTLRAGRNQLSGLIPEELFGSTMPLTELDLSGNRFTGYVRTINSTTLKVLNLSLNALSGPLPSNLGSCVSVDLSKNILSSDLSVMQHWGESLEIVDLSSNALSGSIPNDIPLCRSLISIKISNNSLAGSLPSVLGSCPKLSDVDLSLNKFTGPILPSLFMSSTSMNLSVDQFTGPFPLQGPHSIESLVLPSYNHLESLDLSDNQLSGSLPPEIGSLQRLKLLDLGRNALSGELPSEIGELDGLEFLDLSVNHFKGRIPEMPQRSLEVFNISYNDLSGPVPQNLQRFPRSSFHPGNAFLILPDDTDALEDNTRSAQHSRFRTSIWAAIIVCSFGAVMLIVVVLLAAQKMWFKEYCGKNEFKGPAIIRDANPLRFDLHYTHNSEAKDSLPVPISFSCKHLLASSSRSTSRQGDLVTNTAECSYSKYGSDSAFLELGELKNFPSTIEYKSSLGLPLPSAPHYIDSHLTEQPAVWHVGSPDRLVGELFFFDDSLVFTADELSRAPAEILGRGSFGTKYKAILDCGHVLTIRLLHSGLLKQQKEFAREAKRIGTIGHPNIISVRGYCWGPTEQGRLIIADYANGYSLADYLYESTPGRYSQVSVSQRLKIAIDVAQCLYYLHDRGLPHGNLKPSNIVLKQPDLTAQLTDFSLHCLMARRGTAQQMLNSRALGYQAPELTTASNPCPSLKADIYAFGVILMELLTRRSASDIISGRVGAVDLTDWIQQYVRQGRAGECFDKDIADGEAATKVMEELLAVSLRCILPVKERPNIKTVIEDLQSIAI
ncbi:probable inactive receptor kinase At5g10020 [Phoenix dactylifera]|uniref:Probable inactive receptor kinase At5g10020 n=1 Tax=Phoenix dactylifera TaxID=42345 RepID=A0A8B8JC68_PHODC|nr:probable inactive receptor kinase At5g10020 [Phoenix dactylifera]